MKVFIFSIFALALLIALIITNSFYVRNLTENAYLTLKEIPPVTQASDQAQALLQRWQAEEKILELSVAASEISEVTNRLTELCTAIQFKDEEAFERARALCLLGLARIHDYERFSFLHIL